MRTSRLRVPTSSRWAEPCSRVRRRSCGGIARAIKATQKYPRGGSTGGGVSQRFKRPEWQNVHVRSLNPGGFDGRIVPDVAALAGLPGYSIVFQGQPRMNGGTSASAPLWAALVARIAGAAPGFLAPLLYGEGADGRVRGVSGCKDITKGNNRTPKPGFGYEAAEGFDAVTGWGVPNGRALTRRCGSDATTRVPRPVARPRAPRRSQVRAPRAASSIPPPPRRAWVVPLYSGHRRSTPGPDRSGRERANTDSQGWSAPRSRRRSEPGP